MLNFKENDNLILSKKIEDYVTKCHNYWWWMDFEDVKKLNLDSIIEGVLNYGTLEEVKLLFDTFGIAKVKEIFKKNIGGERNNYFPRVKNFFELYFERNA